MGHPGTIFRTYGASRSSQIFKDNIIILKSKIMLIRVYLCPKKENFYAIKINERRIIFDDSAPGGAQSLSIGRTGHVG